MSPVNFSIRREKLVKPKPIGSREERDLEREKLIEKAQVILQELVSRDQKEEKDSREKEGLKINFYINIFPATFAGNNNAFSQPPRVMAKEPEK